MGWSGGRNGGGRGGIEKKKKRNGAMGTETFMEPVPATQGLKAVPVTLLSGFLGAGKTTLLKSIIEQTKAPDASKKYRVAVLVNDMAEVNIDANLVRDTTMLQKEAKLVELHNGCICCTLREDLIKELADLAATRAFDAIVVESTGVSDPQEVAETFAVPVGGTAPPMVDTGRDTRKEQDRPSDEQEKRVAGQQGWELNSIVKALRGHSSLNELARLDTCVTMVDAASFRDNMFTSAYVREKFKDDGDGVDEADTRNVAPLLMSQIEFADVIGLSKCDLISEEDASAVESSLRALNPGAKVVRANRGDVPLSTILDTNLFSMDRAATSPGWLQHFRDEKVVPETEVYGIDSFVYKARTPFHPRRLYEFFTKHFMVKMTGRGPPLTRPVHESGEGEGEERHERGEGEERHEKKQIPPIPMQNTKTVPDSANNNNGAVVDDKTKAKTKASLPAAAEISAAAEEMRKREKEKEEEDEEKELQRELAELREFESARRQKRMRDSFGTILRSKGYTWIAGRDPAVGEWSQAGAVAEFGMGGFWFAAVTEIHWPKDKDQLAMLMRDFDGDELKDRRQEMVFIGQNLKQDAISAALDACLLTKEDVYPSGYQSSNRSIVETEHSWKLGVKNLDDRFPMWW